jgi:hypothetical protein
MDPHLIPGCHPDEHFFSAVPPPPQDPIKEETVPLNQMLSEEKDFQLGGRSFHESSAEIDQVKKEWEAIQLDIQVHQGQRWIQAPSTPNLRRTRRSRRTLSPDGVKVLHLSRNVES